MPTNHEHMRNAERRSSLAVGETGFPFNTANLCQNGYLLSGRIVRAFNARITPQWTENDRLRHDEYNEMKMGKREGGWRCKYRSAPSLSRAGLNLFKIREELIWLTL